MKRTFRNILLLTILLMIIGATSVEGGITNPEGNSCSAFISAEIEPDVQYIPIGTIGTYILTLNSSNTGSDSFNWSTTSDKMIARINGVGPFMQYGSHSFVSTPYVEQTFALDVQPQEGAMINNGYLVYTDSYETSCTVSDSDGNVSASVEVSASGASASASTSASVEVSASGSASASVSGSVGVGAIVVPIPETAPTVFAFAGSDRTVFSGNTVSFDGSGSHPSEKIVSYKWDFGDGTLAEGKLVNHRFVGNIKFVNDKEYTVKLTVADENGISDTDSIIVNVKPLEKIGKIISEPSPLGGGELGSIQVFYYWLYNKDGEDKYLLRLMNIQTGGYIGYYTIYFWDDDKWPGLVWDDWGNVLRDNIRMYRPPFESTLGLRMPQTIFDVEGIQDIVGTVVDGGDVMQLLIYGLEAGIDICLECPTTPLYEVTSIAFQPDYVEPPHVIVPVPDAVFAHIASPGELRIYDEEGRVTGLVNGIIKEEIPFSVYDDKNKTAMTLNSSNHFEVKGTDNGNYGLNIFRIKEGNFTTFNATHIPTNPNEVHKYSIDWNVLSNGEKGVTLKIDNEGDGLFDRTVQAGPILTDITPPQITVNIPVNNTTYILNETVFANWSVIDLESGIASKTGTKQPGEAIDTTIVGSKTFTVNAVDNAENSATKTVSYDVIYNFNGFFQPVDNLPTLNSVKAGSAIPVKFNLTGNQSLDIFATGYPASQKITCDSNVPIDNIEETITAGSSNLSYNESIDQYNYIWKTNKDWVGTCRNLAVKLKDGKYHNASFKFK